MKSNLKLIYKLTDHEPIRLAIILGSGLGEISNDIDGVGISYKQLKGFDKGKVSGHKSELLIGTLYGQRVAILSGRSHFYENGDPSAMRTPLETVKELGAEFVILTNSAGSLDIKMPPGSIMVISDHVNFSGTNPLIGEPTDKRFVNMTNAYDYNLRQQFQNASIRENIKIHEGQYCWLSGPSFETPAEINIFSNLGLKAVGMSTVPEVILSRFFEMKVLAISTITNMAAGMSSEELSHNHTKKMAPLGATKIKKILKSFLRNLK